MICDHDILIIAILHLSGCHSHTQRPRFFWSAPRIVTKRNAASGDENGYVVRGTDKERAFFRQQSFHQVQLGPKTRLRGDLKAVMSIFDSSLILASLLCSRCLGSSRNAPTTAAKETRSWRKP